MDSKDKKTNGSATTDELDLEPLDLDFNLELPSLDEPPGGDAEFELPASMDWEAEGAASGEGVGSEVDEGPITLTADELDDIVSTDLSGGRAQAKGQGPADDEGFELPDIDESDLAFEPDEDLVPLGSEFGGSELTAEGLPDGQDLDLEAGQASDDILDIDLTDEFMAGGAIDEGGSHPEPIDIDPALDGEVDLPNNASNDLADDELVSLSEDELDNILGDLDDEGDAATGEEHEAGSEEHEDASELAAAFDDAPARTTADHTPEFDEIESSGAEEAFPSVSILDADEDESITLTADELSNIVSEDLSVVEDGDSVEFGAGSAFEEPSAFDASDISFEPEGMSGTDAAVPAGESSFFHDDGEEGPVALTDDELADILEGTTVEMVSGAGAVEEPPRAERMAEELSMETGFKRDELRQIIGYLDNLLGQLPEDTVREFSRSEYFNLYKKVIEDLGIYQ